MDFTMELLEAHGCDVVMNVVDSVSKQAHFIMTATMITTLKSAWLYMAHTPWSPKAG